VLCCGFDPCQRSNESLLACSPEASLSPPVDTPFIPTINKYSGRDIALSNNQSPVLKFYNSTYTDAHNRSLLYKDNLWNVRGMQLWNDWNLQVHQWGRDHLQSSSSLNTNNNNDNNYLLMRSEDLVDPKTRGDCWQRLADFVGSTLSAQQVCCAARSEPKDFGQSVIHNEHQGNNWKTTEEGKMPKWDPLSYRNNNHDIDTNTNPNTLLVKRMEQKETQLNQLEASLKHRDEHLQQLEASLEQKQESLGRLEVELKALLSEGKQQQQQQQRGGSNTTPTTTTTHLRHGSPRRQRRRLLQKLVPTQFVKDFQNWKHVVETQSDTLRLESIGKLARYGHDLQERWTVNAQALAGLVELKEIQTLTTMLEAKLAKAAAETGEQQLSSSPRQNDGEVHKVHSRYGKWQSLLANNTELSEYLHREGKHALQVFGYEPRREMMIQYLVRNTTNATDFVCDETIQCPHKN
jgi:hypothetical protein